MRWTITNSSFVADASKALIQEPFLFPNYILQTDTDGNLHAV